MEILWNQTNQLTSVKKVKGLFVLQYEASNADGAITNAVVSVFTACPTQSSLVKIRLHEALLIKSRLERNWGYGKQPKNIIFLERSGIGEIRV